MSKRTQAAPNDVVAEDVVMVRLDHEVVGHTYIAFLADVNERQLELLRRLDGSCTLRATEDDSSAPVVGGLMAVFDMIGVEIGVLDLLRDDDVNAIRAMGDKEFDFSAYEAECFVQRSFMLEGDKPVRRVETFPVRVTEMITFSHVDMD